MDLRPLELAVVDQAGAGLGERRHRRRAFRAGSNTDAARGSSWFSMNRTRRVAGRRGRRTRWQPHLLGALVHEPVVEPLVVAEVEALLLQRPLQVPVRLGHEPESGMRLVAPRRSPSASSRPAVARRPRSPQVRAKMSFITSIAMSQRTPSHWSAMSRSVSTTAARSCGENALSCTTSGQAGRYGSRPQAQTAPPTSMNDSGSAARSSAVPWTNSSGWATVHGWSGATWFGTKSSMQAEPTARERVRERQRDRPGRRGAGRRRSRGRSRASRRRPPGGSRAGLRRSSRHSAAFDMATADTGRAARPHAHEPHGVEAALGDHVPARLRHGPRGRSDRWRRR